MLTEVTCPICSAQRGKDARFCKRHDRAREQLESAFGRWKSAYGGQLQRKTFLERVLQMPDAGQKVREVIRFLLENETS